jgi:hypothetical protein
MYRPTLSRSASLGLPKDVSCWAAVRTFAVQVREVLQEKVIQWLTIGAKFALDVFEKLSMCVHVSANNLAIAQPIFVLSNHYGFHLLQFLL